MLFSFLILSFIGFAFTEKIFLGTEEFSDYHLRGKSLIDLKSFTVKDDLKLEDATINGYLNDIAVDSFGNIFGCGDVDGSSGVIKYNPQGEVLWKKSMDTCSSLAINSKNVVFVTACKELEDVICQVYLTALKNDDGSTLFDIVVGGDDDDVPTSIAIDHTNDENIFITGFTYSTTYEGKSSIGRPDGFLSKFSSLTGQPLSTLRFGSEVTNRGADNDDSVGGHTVPYSLTIDSSNNIYIAGYLTGNFMNAQSFGLFDAFYLKVASNTNDIQYAKLIGTPQNDMAYDITWSSKDNFLYLTGWSSGSFPGGPEGQNSGGKDGILSKIDPLNGNQIFNRLFGTLGDDLGNGIVVDPNDPKKIFVTGSTAGNLNGVTSKGNEDAFLVQFNDQGVLQSTVLYGTNGYDSGNCLAVNSSMLFLGGYREANLVTEDVDTFLVGHKILMELIPLEGKKIEKCSEIRDKMGKYVKNHAEAKSSGKCLKYVRKAIEAGLNLDEEHGLQSYYPKTSGKCENTWSAGNQKASLRAIGFKEIAKPSLDGDIALYTCSKEHPNGHIQMLYKNKWYSDFAQKSAIIYQNLGDSKIFYFRFEKCN